MKSKMFVDDDGSKVWHDADGCLHRADGPALEYEDGSKYWYRNGQLHRIDGPAVERADGSQSWYKHGVLHCLTGPALEIEGYQEWWIDGKRVTEEQFNDLTGV